MLTPASSRFVSLDSLSSDATLIGVTWGSDGSYYAAALDFEDPSHPEASSPFGVVTVLEHVISFDIDDPAVANPIVKSYKQSLRDRFGWVR